MCRVCCVYASNGNTERGAIVFLVKNKRGGTIDFVFTRRDPRECSPTLLVVEDVLIDSDDNIDSWPDGHDYPDVLLGQDATNSKCFKVFKYKAELDASGFVPIAGSAFVRVNWSEYADVYPSDLNLTD